MNKTHPIKFAQVRVADLAPLKAILTEDQIHALSQDVDLDDFIHAYLCGTHEDLFR